VDSTGRHSKQLRNRVGRTIVDGTGFVNSGAAVRGALKALEKPGIIREISVDTGPFLIALNQKRQICALPEIYC
jgi:hypothetical protein